MDLSRLKDPFPTDDIEWRVQRDGMRDGKAWAIVLAYVTNRAIMDRLDNVCGPENWHNEYVAGPSGGVLCGISIRVGDDWLTKWDGADNTDIEQVKGGLSGAMKRAAVQWGIGRYLYHLEATFANIHPGGRYRGYHKDSKTAYKWDPPALPGWALPDTGAKKAETPKRKKAETPKRKGEYTIDEMRAMTAKYIHGSGLSEAMRHGYLDELNEADKAGDTNAMRDIYVRVTRAMETADLDKQADKEFDDTDAERSEAENSIPAGNPSEELF